MSNYTNVYDPKDSNHSWTIALGFVRENAEILEVGCGNGYFAQAMMDLKQCKVDAIEPDRGDAALAAKIIPRIFVGTVEESISQLKDKKYDQIVFLDVIEHLYDPAKTLASLMPYLKDEGEVIFSIPNMAHTSVRIMLLNGEFDAGKTGLLDSTHLHFYTKREINRVFNKAGYRVKMLRGTVEAYPPEIMKQELAKIGVTNIDKDIVNVLRSNHGDVYQYVGIASKAKFGSSYSEELPESSPMVHAAINEYNASVEKYIKKTIRHFEKIIRAKDDQIAQLHQDVKSTQQELQNSNKSLLSRVNKMRRSKD